MVVAITLVASGAATIQTREPLVEVAPIPLIRPPSGSAAGEGVGNSALRCFLASTMRLRGHCIIDPQTLLDSQAALFLRVGFSMARVSPLGGRHELIGTFESFPQQHIFVFQWCSILLGSSQAVKIAPRRCSFLNKAHHQR